MAKAEARALQNFDSDNKQRSIIPKHFDTPVNRNQYTARNINDHSENKFDMDLFSTCESESVFSYSNHEKSNNKETPTIQKSILKELSSENVKTPESPTVVRDLTRFLLKKDLLFSRFSHFNDKPETFTIWKTSFKSITKELQVTPFVEMDLLVNFLGPESFKFAAGIRIANTTYLKRGLKRIWPRLQERYGSPELVESALKTKLRDFPRITNRHSKRLYELVGILAEIEAIKEDPNYSALSSYFNSSSGINPIEN